MIRDLIRQISDGNEYIKGCSVGVVDERSELGGCYLGIAQNHLGTRTDILDCCPKRRDDHVDPFYGAACDRSG